jgi:hypothetical protein
MGAIRNPTGCAGAGTDGPAVAVRLAAIEAGVTGLLPRLRLRTRSGQWANVG